MKLNAVPVALLLKYNDFISFALPERFFYKQSWREGEKIGKVVILRDIDTKTTHTGHLRILQDLAQHNAASYNELHAKWLEVLDTNILNKKFFQELSNWYFWAMDKVQFPDDKEKDKEIRNATNLIRLITRIVFIWFIKEKGLVPKKLFDTESLKNIIKDFNKGEQSRNYYNAILQNLFFGTLNQSTANRKFAANGGYTENRSEHGVYTLYRYAELFVIPENDILKLFANIPFLNGGLFDCLDKSFKDKNGKNNSIYIDGFSREVKKQAIVPDFLFFGAEQNVDLNNIYDTRDKIYKTKGLINLLKSYKFTITENTLQEEDVALEPELLGKVFENLLASYNSETKTTARKQTGSFYTPREIVDYMVDESLIAYLKNYFLKNSIGILPSEQKQEEELEKKFRLLFDYCSDNPFNESDIDIIIQAIDNCKILDLACGSGAFPMGILHRMTDILGKIDPKNRLWKQRQIDIASKIEDVQARENAILNIEDAFTNNELDYGRKLYLIENCIYGVDIQSIAVQIAKLRFFISLVINQRADELKDNFGIRSLPNLETKFVAANTLIGLEKPKGVLSTSDRKEIRIQEELKQIRHEYFTANTRTKKLRLQQKDEELRIELAKELEAIGFAEESAKSIANWNPYDQNTHAEWFEPEWMFGLTQEKVERNETSGFFDIVIGNPPYIQLQKNGGKLSKLYGPKQENKKTIPSPYKTFSSMGDLYSLFYEKGHQLLKQDGHLCFITSNKWMRAGYGENTRKFFTEQTTPVQLIDFAGVKVFESATVDVNILMFSKDKKQQKTKACVIKKEDKESIKDLSVYFMQNASECNFSTSDNWVILSSIEQHIKAKIEAVGTPLKDWDINIYRGILTGCNEAFIIDKKKKDELVAADPKSDEIIRPLLRGRDIKRYGYEFADLWLLFIPWHFPLQNDSTINGASEKAEQMFQQQYPAVYNHLLQYKKSLSARNKAETGIRYEWYALQRWGANYWEDFYRPKIMYPNMTKFLPFYYDNKGFFQNDKSFMIVGKNICFLTAFLNSSLFKFCFINSFPSLGENGRELRKIFFDKIPVLQVDFNTDNIFKKKINHLQQLKQNNQSTKNIEIELDNMIFDLYALTTKERETISFIEIR
ncbi:MAG: Eco57I restriction-modification methylase domain-containing protein [Campylobacteraceae bacterium]|nr:Eco57I restriction-modification methylase domain-containing protein [Campylobacteraceae bacterium]